MQSQDNHQGRILVVDDEPTVAMTLTEMLLREGYSVKTAGNGEEAISALKAEEYDVIVTDLVMEKRDGLQVIRQAHERSPETVVIVLTGHGTMDTAVEALRLGAYDYLHKPCKNSSLMKTIRKGLEEKRLRQQLRLRTDQLEGSTRELSKKNLQLSALHRVSSNLQSHHDEDELLHHIAGAICLNLGLRHVLIGTTSDDGCYLQWRSADGIEPMGQGSASEQRRISSQEMNRILGQAKKIGQSYYIEDEIDAGLSSSGPGSSESPGKPKQFRWCSPHSLLIPLASIESPLLGLIVVQVSDNSRPPSVETVEMLETLASTASAALERVRIEKRLMKIYDLSTEMASAGSIKEIIDIVVQAMRNILQFDHCSVNVFDMKRRFLTTVAAIGFPERELGRQFVIEKNEGVSTWVAKTGKIANIPDVRKDPRYAAGTTETLSELAVPIRMRNRIYGVLNVERNQIGQFGDNDVKPLLALASQTAVAIDYKRLEEKLTALYALNQEMSLASGLDELVEVVLDGALRIMEFDHCALMMIDEEKNELYVKSLRGFHEHVERFRFPLSEGKGITIHVAKTGKPVYVPDVSQDPRYVRGWSGTQSELAVPLKIGERVVGVFNVESCERDAFDDTDFKLVVTLASQTAAALESKRLMEEMSKTKNFLENLVDNSVDAIITTDTRGRITFLSKGAESIFGYSAREILHQPAANYFVQGREEARKIMMLLRQDGKIQNYEMECYSKGGQILSVSLSASFLRNEKGRIVGTVGISKDITEVKKLERRIKETKRYLENYIERSQDALFAIDLDGIITMWNSGAERLYGYAKSEAIAQSADELLDPKHHTRKALDVVKGVRKFGGLVDPEVVRVRKDGLPVHVTATFSPITDAEGYMTGVSIIDKDISQRKRLEVALRRINTKLKELSVLDDLTKIYNRRYLNQRIDEEIKRSKRFGRPLAFVMLDIDHFKTYNDTYGHPKGDDVLRTLATILTENCRDVDLVARYGGEEFCILLPETPVSEALHQAERIRRLVETYAFDGEELLPGGRLTISLGVAVYPDEVRSKRQMFECADRALYWAKEGGRNRVKVYSASNDVQVASESREKA